MSGYRSRILELVGDDGLEPLLLKEMIDYPESDSHFFTLLRNMARNNTIIFNGKLVYRYQKNAVKNPTMQRKIVLLRRVVRGFPDDDRLLMQSIMSDVKLIYGAPDGLE